MHTKHGWNAIPEKWGRISRPPVGTTIDLRITLKPQNENALIDALYGAYLSKEQVAELVAPHPDTLKLVESWLGHHGVPLSNVSRSHGGGWLTVTGIPVSKANELLGASYHFFQHAETKETILCTLSYALPSALHRIIQTVAPTTYFGSPGTLQQRPRVHHGGTVATLVSHEQFITPATLRSLYTSEGYVPAATDKNVLGITGFHGQYASYNDLKELMDIFCSDASDATFSVVEIDSSGYDEDDPGLEGNIDIQYSQAIAYPIPQVFYSIGGAPPPFIPDSYEPRNTNEPWLDWLGHMVDLPVLPQTLSASYGGKSRPSRLTTRRACARGVSLLFSSGDSGVGGADCKKNTVLALVEFQPVFPSTCTDSSRSPLRHGFARPYVTSVGGTKETPEIAVQYSSGGFSNVFKRTTPWAISSTDLAISMRACISLSSLYAPTCNKEAVKAAAVARLLLIIHVEDSC
ncbi:Pro-kumamolisin, activation domain-containing protein [Lactarius quietus]|nr:Pro-kumamolisin, activation domain-containing protein [Lactarius quietus]